jgi:hypothetical protein
MNGRCVMPCLLKHIRCLNRQVLINFESHVSGWQGEDFLARKLCGVCDCRMDCI